MITPQVIIDEIDLTMSLVTLYTCPAKQKATIQKFSLFNHTSTARTVNIYLIRSGGSATGIYQKAMDQNIPPGQEADLGTMRQLMNAGDFIQGSASANSAISVSAFANIHT